jgi:uncharacterized protein YecE (DUF72 family)
VADNLSLFSPEEPLSFDRAALHDRLHALAVRDIFIGGSSWKYEGWLDQIYSRSRYQTRGRFSKRLFEGTCLSEYAETFPTVCGDFAFYQFPTDAFWAKLFRQTPDAFRWGFKIPEQITVPTWPVLPRYGALAGRENPTFLDAQLLEQSFIRAIEPWRKQVGVLIFEFGAMRNTTPPEFVRLLDPFLSQLPSGWRYAVEIRNAEFLRPEYFACLRAHNVTHVYNAWTRMPEIVEQLAIPDSQTSDLIVARALLRHGRAYEDAVRQFAPYDRTREVNEPVRRGLREIVDIARVDGRPAFLFVNNRLEGNSPATIVAITD